MSNTIGPQLHRRTYVYTYVKGCLCPHGMHGCSVHLHASSTIHVYWDLAVAQPHPLVPIWQPCTCMSPNVDSVHSGTCTHTAINFGPVAVSMQPLHPTRQELGPHRYGCVNRAYSMLPWCISVNKLQMHATASWRNKRALRQNFIQNKLFFLF